MYAEDTVLYLPIDKNIPNSTINNFQTNLNNFSKWCFDNKLSINGNKTQIMLLGKILHPRNLPNLNNLLHLNNTYLQHTSSYKYLGVIHIPSLNFTEQNTKIIRLVNLKINTMSHIRDSISQCTSLLIYKGTILPQMEYANILFHLSSKKIKISFSDFKTEPLESFTHILPTRATRNYITELDYPPYSPGLTVKSISIFLVFCFQVR